MHGVIVSDRIPRNFLVVELFFLDHGKIGHAAILPYMEILIM